MTAGTRSRLEHARRYDAREAAGRAMAAAGVIGSVLFVAWCLM